MVGAFNCQGGGWCPETRRNKCASQYSHTVAATATAADIEWNHAPTLTAAADPPQVFALYTFKQKTLTLSKPSDGIEISLDPFHFELVTVSPVTSMKNSVRFAPIGLANMLNTGGAIRSLEFDGEGNSVRVGVKGRGEMRAFASAKPRACLVNGEVVGFGYEEMMVVVQVPWPGSSGVSVVEYSF